MEDSDAASGDRQTDAVLKTASVFASNTGAAFQKEGAAFQKDQSP